MNPARTALSCITAHRKDRLIPIEQITHFMADTKFVMAYYPGGELLLDDALKDLEVEFSDQFIRAHRNLLVVRTRMKSLTRSVSRDYYDLAVDGVPEPLRVSRRQAPIVRRELKGLDETKKPGVES